MARCAQNLAWRSVYNLVMLPLAAAALAPLRPCCFAPLAALLDGHPEFSITVVLTPCPCMVAADALPARGRFPWCSKGIDGVASPTQLELLRQWAAASGLAPPPAPALVEIKP